MSKLAVIRKSLETNPEVVIAGVYERNHLPDRNSLYPDRSHEVYFRVAPTRATYETSKLKEFMLGLVPKGLELTRYSRPLGAESLQVIEQHGYKGKALDYFLGQLFFSEEIGQEKITRECVLTDEELSDFDGFVGGRRSIEVTRPYKRETTVMVFPSRRFATHFHEGKLYMLAGGRLGIVGS